MQFYSAKIRLSGSPMNEVRGVYSAPEILVMLYIHGVDSVTEVKKEKSEALNMRELKEKLKGMYDPALVKREQSIDKIFGALGQLPVKLPDELIERYDIVDEDDVVSVAKSVTKSDKSANSEYNTVTQLQQDRLDRIVSKDQISINDIME